MTNRLACVIALLLLDPFSATAQAGEREPRICPATTLPDDIGGTTNNASREPGIGGTGAPARGEGEDGDGIGGTGMSRIAAHLPSAIGKVMAIDSHHHVFMLTEGSELCAGDRLETGANSAAKLVFTDGTVALIRATTRLTLNHYTWQEEQPEKAKFQLTLLEGGLQFVSGKLSKSHPEAFQLNTPNSTIGVLGTEYQVVHFNKPNDDLAPGTYASVTSGEIRMSNDYGAIRLKAGEAAVARSSESPSRLQFWPDCLICRSHD